MPWYNISVYRAVCRAAAPLMRGGSVERPTARRFGQRIVWCSHGVTFRVTHDQAIMTERSYCHHKWVRFPTASKAELGCVKNCPFFNTHRKICSVSRCPGLPGEQYRSDLAAERIPLENVPDHFWRLPLSQKPSRSFSRLILAPSVRYGDGASENNAHMCALNKRGGKSLRMFRRNRTAASRGRFFSEKKSDRPPSVLNF